MIPYMKFRQVKLELENGRWIVLRKQAASLGCALELASANQYKNAYISVACWSEASRVIRKPSMLSHKFFGADFVAETDFADKQEAFFETEKIACVLGHMGFHRLLFVETARGYHVWVLDFRTLMLRKLSHMKVKPEAPANWWLQEMKVLARKLQDAGCRFDFNTSCDIMRIVRMPGSYHESGLKCRYSFDLYSLRPTRQVSDGNKDEAIRLTGGEERR